MKIGNRGNFAGKTYSGLKVKVTHSQTRLSVSPGAGLGIIKGGNMQYIIKKAVREKFNKEGKQITRDGLMAIDIKVEQLIEKACKQFNGHHTRITSININLLKI